MVVPRPVRMHWTGCPNSCGQVSLTSRGLHCRKPPSLCLIMIHCCGPQRVAVRPMVNPFPPAIRCVLFAALQVQVADIGFMGCTARDEVGRPCEGVHVLVGGKVGADSHLGEVHRSSVPCKDLLPVVQELLVEKFGATRK